MFFFFSFSATAQVYTAFPTADKTIKLTPTVSEIYAPVTNYIGNAFVFPTNFLRHFFLQVWLKLCVCLPSRFIGKVFFPRALFMVANNTMRGSGY